MKRILTFLVCLTMAISLAACGGSEKKEKSGNISLKYYFPLNAQDDNDMILGKANEHIKEKLGVDMNFIAVDFANYSQKMQLINASKEEYDLCFTSNWSNDYYKNVENGNLAPLDDLLKQYAPDLIEKIGSRYWDGIRVDGKIYGVINRQIMAREAGYVIPYAFANEQNINYSEEFKTLDGIKNYIKAVQEKHPNAKKVLPFALQYMQTHGLEFFMGDNFPVAVYTNLDGKPVVVNPYETKEYKEYIAARKQWVSEGIAPQNMTVDNEALNAVFFTNGELSVPIAPLSTNKPGVEAEMLSNNEVEAKAVPMGGALISSGSAASTLLGISQTSQNQEAAMKYISLINSDKELYNLLAFGIEGRNYDKISENKIKPNKEHSYVTANWSMGDVFNSFLLEGQPDNVWEETKNMNDNAELSPLFGFTPDTSPLSVQISNCTSVYSEFIKPLEWGVGDVDSTYSDFIKKLGEAGVNDIITEMQKQIDTWYNN